MSKSITKEDQRYQLSKIYTFRDLELSLMVKRDEVDKLKSALSHKEKECAGLRYDLKQVIDAHTPLEKRS